MWVTQITHVKQEGKQSTSKHSNPEETMVFGERWTKGIILRELNKYLKYGSIR